MNVTWSNWFHIAVTRFVLGMASELFTHPALWAASLRLFMAAILSPLTTPMGASSISSPHPAHGCAFYSDSLSTHHWCQLPPAFYSWWFLSSGIHVTINSRRGSSIHTKRNPPLPPWVLTDFLALLSLFFLLVDLTGLAHFHPVLRVASILANPVKGEDRQIRVSLGNKRKATLKW